MFVKMNGLGNDYLFIDGEKVPENQLKYLETHIKELAPRISDRHFGVGGDGVVIIYASRSQDAEMLIFNADGSLGKTCGNALRCVGRYLSLKHPGKRYFRVGTSSGVSEITVSEESVEATLSKAVFLGKKEGAYFVNVGNPHAVMVSESLSDTNFSLAEEMTRVYDVNAELVRPESDNSFTMRVSERGSGETLACGSGAAAAAAVLNKLGLKKFPMTGRLKGGELTIDINSGGVLSISGAAEINYTGEIDIFRYGQIKRQLF